MKTLLRLVFCFLFIFSLSENASTLSHGGESTVQALLDLPEDQIDLASAALAISEQSCDDLGGLFYGVGGGIQLTELKEMTIRLKTELKGERNPEPIIQK